jgi:hypothetical protein
MPDGFCCEKPCIEINRNRIKDRIFPGFKQHYFKKIKLTDFARMTGQYEMIYGSVLRNFD